MEILRAISDDCGSLYQKVWIEPFVGGANMMQHLTRFDVKRKVGIDINLHVINMFIALQGGWKPLTEVNEHFYQELKKNSDVWSDFETSALTGFVGIGCSYSGKWFGGYARGNDNKGVPRNYARESADNVLTQIKSLKDVEFYHGNYKDLFNVICEPNEEVVIYCDPPYANTTKYKNSFDHTEFWKWCDEMVQKGFRIYVSEYNAPEGWRCIWSKEVNNSLTKETGSKQGVEKLFTK